ncbi:ADP-ribosylglycohydrolase family protein [Thermogemmatispora sp.]|uniref:ADP-ribosylglycohydrolase family protein n=1 Tax=Thermogemmatispora sp. TaxID=1968838 RepID=UPI001DBE99AC|nr:ADP-ribosylglycohydrolase family protein [Thermogemmatispora sp.]MBX5448448.1 ADP-ribosylglycohydrolase family protein [Thermogemmatispora sp.]
MHEAGGAALREPEEREQRARGALLGLAIGDALGMPTQMLPRSVVAQLFPSLEGFEAGPPQNAISAGQPAGKVTDDTQQALLVARLLVEGQGHVISHRFVEELLRWAELAEADGSEQLGPSSRRALEAVRRGLRPEEAGRRGDTNGAAMRIAPVGIAVPLEPARRFLERIEEVCRPTHFTGVAIAGATAVAAVISAGVAGASFQEALGEAQHLARQAQEHGAYVAAASVAERLIWAVDLVSHLDEESAQDAIVDLIGTGVATQEAVPAAFAIAARWRADPWRACLIAARLGGDSDTIAALVGAMLGACAGLEVFPQEARTTVVQVNALDIDRLVSRLLALRDRLQQEEVR